MAIGAMAYIVEDTVSRLEGITPSVDAHIKWARQTPGRRIVPEKARDRHVALIAWEPIGDVMVFGAGEQQISRALHLTVSYVDSPDAIDRMHCDEVDLEEALCPASTYPTGSWGALRIRRVLRDQVKITFSEGHYLVDFPVLCVFREPVTVSG